MRNKKIAAYICTELLLMTTGCSNSYSDTYVSKADTINFNDEDIEKNISNSQTGEEIANSLQNTKENNNLQDDDNNQSNSSKNENENNSQSANEDSILDGSIISIENNSIIINKTFNLSSTTAVAYGGDDAVFVTVYFSENTNYEVWTVKNSGVNGDSDIDKREGTFSDIKEQLSVNMTGFYEGDDFYAKQVIIYNFV
ncbi:MAG: hypothetical protein HDR03_06015 [Lachnospiraceae bacterium]|nr:hypothetical protein [Lachnospiraceae bacterium]